MAAAVESWRRGALRLTGNRVEVLEVDGHEFRRLLESGRPLWSDVREDGVVVFGTGIAALTAGRIA